jgi:hypothetical protein
MMVRVRHHSTTRNKERVESPLSFRAKLRTLGGEERKKRGGKATRLINVLGLIM